MTQITDAHLRMWRARERLSQSQAGALMSVSRQTIALWEAGKHPEDLGDRLQSAAVRLQGQREELTHGRS